MRKMVEKPLTDKIDDVKEKEFQEAEIEKDLSEGRRLKGWMK